MASIASWIYDKPLRGNYTFTHDEVSQAFPNMSAGSIARALTREVSKGRIMSPLRGFYVIVPNEYVLRGAVPQSFYLDDMMHHLGRKYYVALLSAASYHGASHQVPLRFSVMIEPPAMRDKKGKKYLTHYFCKSHIPEAYVERRQTRTGYINVPVTSLQRLGYILDEVLEEVETAESVYSLLKCSGFVLQYVPLKAGKSSEGCERNAKWRIIVNETIEIDEL